MDFYNSKSNSSVNSDDCAFQIEANFINHDPDSEEPQVIRQGPNLTQIAQ